MNSSILLILLISLPSISVLNLVISSNDPFLPHPLLNTFGLIFVVTLLISLLPPYLFLISLFLSLFTSLLVLLLLVFTPLPQIVSLSPLSLPSSAIFPSPLLITSLSSLRNLATFLICVILFPLTTPLPLTQLFTLVVPYFLLFPGVFLLLVNFESLTLLFVFSLIVFFTKHLMFYMPLVIIFLFVSIPASLLSTTFSPSIVPLFLFFYLILFILLTITSLLLSLALFLLAITYLLWLLYLFSLIHLHFKTILPRWLFIFVFTFSPYASYVITFLVPLTLSKSFFFSLTIPL